jgi:heptosyltransferase III
LLPNTAEVFSRPEIQRVLIYRLGSLGDSVVALPCYHLIARAFPKAERRLLTNIPIHAKAPAAAAVLGDSGLVQAYIQYPIRMRSPRQILAVRAEIRKFQPQVLIYLSSLRGFRAAQRDRLFFRACGIRSLIGFPESSQDCERRILLDTAALEPEAARLARAIRALGVVDLDDPGNWNLRLNTAEIERAEEIKQRLGPAPILAVSVGTKVPAKDWGEANWAALLTRLAILLPQHRLVLIGAGEEAAVSERAAAAWGERCLNLCGSLTPRESAAVIRLADLFLGHDSGPMHLAAAVGVPCVAIFAALNIPRVWFPYGGRHRVIYHRTDCAGCELDICVEQKKKCILSITVEEVLAAVLAQLGVSSESGRTRSVTPGVHSPGMPGIDGYGTLN